MLRKEDAPAFGWRCLVFYLLALILFVLPVWLYHQGVPHGFGDARVYGRAIRTAAAGGDPYQSHWPDLPFVYPPLVVRFGVLLDTVIPHRAIFPIYIPLTWIAVLSLPWIVCAGYIRSRWFGPALGMLIFALQPFFMYEQILFIGNVVLLLLPLALLTGIRGVRYHRWGIFYVVVGLSSLVKAPMLALLLLPALSEEHELRPSILTGLCVSAAYIVQRFTMPHAYAEYQRNVWEEVMVHQDHGFNLMNYLVHQNRHLTILGRPAVAFSIQAGAIVLLVALFYWRRHRREDEEIRPLWVPALLVLSIVADPRLQHIDACAALLPCLYLWVECIRRLEDSTFWLRILIVGFVVFQFLTVKQFEMGELLLLYGSLILVLVLVMKPVGALSRRSES